MVSKQRSSRKQTQNAKSKLDGDTINNGADSTTTPDAISAAPGLFSRISWRHLAIRFVFMAVLMFFVSSYNKDKTAIFASQKDEIKKRSMTVTCSQDYIDELKTFPGCAPKSCGRVVFDSLVTSAEVSALLHIAKRGLSMGSAMGGAAILDLHSGALSHSNAFVNLYKLEEAENLFTDQDFKIYSHVKEKIQEAVSTHFGVQHSLLHLTHPTFFSRLNSAPPLTVHDEYWHAHVDKETYESFHYTSLLYLSDYGLDFDGGQFVFVDAALNQTIEPRSGRVSAFTSGSENIHFVERVSRGTRYAITISFTCDGKHAIRDPSLPQSTKKV